MPFTIFFDKKYTFVYIWYIFLPKNNKKLYSMKNT